MIFSIFGALAEFERELIRERTIAGITAARARGRMGGRKFNTKTKENLHLLKENRATLTNILFINENEIFVTSDDKQINYYKID